VGDAVKALEQMSASLLPEGVMVHGCPNYAVPYEPHYGIPLVPFAPAATKWLLPKRVTEDGDWLSLNFITANEVGDTAQRLGCEVTFEAHAMYEAFQRLGSDAGMRERHGTLARFYEALESTGVLSLLKRLPPRLATPMVFAWRHRTHP
jgi:hypothetical protein